MLGVGRFGPRGGDHAAGAGAWEDRPRPDALLAEPLGGGSGGSGGPLPPIVVAADRVDDAERDAWVVLNEVDGVGPVTFGRLVARLGSARAVLETALEPGGLARLVDASADEAGGWPRLTADAARALAAAASDPRPVLEPVRRAGVTVLVLADAAYPPRLRQTGLPPPVLYLRGALEALERPRAVAIVGTRRPTEVGRLTAGRIADAVSAHGATVVSGLALGIDAVAHGVAVAAGVPTVAVIGGGHERLYPASHRGLVRRIVATGGAVISEFAPETHPTRGTFPRRNRVISGLADATVVVEAGARSGALTTAAWALEQGRSLFIVPGRLDDPAVAGSLAFLREAGPEARIVAGIPELLEDLGFVPVHSSASEAAGIAGPAPAPTPRPGEAARPHPAAPETVLSALPPVERAIAREVLAGRSGVDELVEATGLGGATVLGALTALEVRGLVLETFGRYRGAGPLAAGRPRSSVPRVGPRTAAMGTATARSTTGGEER